MGKSATRRKNKPTKGPKRKAPGRARMRSTNPVAELLQQGIEHHQLGRFQDAERIYLSILKADPNHADANHLLGVIAYQVGKYEIAEQLISKAIQADPRQPLYHLNLGNVYQDQNRPEDAIDSYQRALVLNPDFPEAHNNMGNSAKALGQPERAIACFQKALAIRPDYVEALNNLGNSLKDVEQYEEAISLLRKAVTHAPTYADAHFNLARAQFSDGQTDNAVASCRQAIAIKPDFVDAYINLGVILHKQGNLDASLETSRQAVSMDPDNPVAHVGLANVLRELGSLDEAVSSYRRVIALKPDDEEAWGNLQQTIKTLLFSKGLDRQGDNSHTGGLATAARSSCHFSQLEYYLDSFRPHEADASFNAAMAALPDRGAKAVDQAPPGAQPPTLFNQTVALFHFGRSGTGLMHSLIDNHPEISTLPSIYLSGYFNAGIWEELAAGGLENLPERFADKFAVLFDANSPKPVPGTQKDGISNAGAKEGTASVGNNRDEVLSVDRNLFCAHAQHLIAPLDYVDADRFLKIVHAAYEHALGRTADKHTIFYHIHNPNAFAKLNFLRHVPEARLMMMVRDPLQSCESWMRRAYENHEYASMSFRIVTMLYDIDQVAFRRQDSIGVRLEDLKSRPKATMAALSNWLGIKESASMYEMTAQGKKWWGDPSSPSYNAQNGMLPFDDACMKRPGGAIFGERDRLLLRTLFYPFSVRFGYCDTDPDGFARDLKEARGLLNDLFDFEQSLIDKTGGNIRQFQQGNNYRMLRAALTDRFDVLDEFGTYPHMLTPLALKQGGEPA